MLLFQPEHISMIIDGTKTQTRRVWKKPRAKTGSIHQVRTKLFIKSDIYIKIIGVRKERLGEITKSDAIKEGYKTIGDYLLIWLKINGKIDYNQEVYVIDFCYYGDKKENE